MTVRERATQARLTAGSAVTGFFADGAPQSAAAISYYALVSLFPLAILLVAVFGLAIDESDARAEVIDFVLEQLPLTADQGRDRIEELLTSVTEDSGGFGIFGAVGLVVAASGVMGAVRKALNRVWGVEDPRPFAQAKGVDVLLVAVLGLVVAASFALTIIVRFTSGVVGGLGQIAPVLVSFGAFVVLFRVAPARRTSVRDVWPGAFVAALGFELAKTAFSVYLENFANYSAVYASLAAVVAFLVFVFVAANLVLFGAEVAVEWPRVRDGEVTDTDDDTPAGERVKQAVKGLFVRDRRPEPG